MIFRAAVTRDPREYHRLVARACADRTELEIDAKHATEMLWACETHHPSSGTSYRKNGMALLNLWKMVGYPVTCPELTQIMILLNEQLTDSVTAWNSMMRMMHTEVSDAVLRKCSRLAAGFMASRLCPSHHKSASCPCAAHSVLREIDARVSCPRTGAYVWVRALHALALVLGDTDRFEELEENISLECDPDPAVLHEIAVWMGRTPRFAASAAMFMMYTRTFQADEMYECVQRVTNASELRRLSHHFTDAMYNPEYGVRVRDLFPAALSVWMQNHQYVEAAVVAMNALRAGNATYHPVLLRLAVRMDRIADIFPDFWTAAKPVVTESDVRAFCSMPKTLAMGDEMYNFGLSRLLSEYFGHDGRTFTPEMWMRMVYGLLRIARRVPMSSDHIIVSVIQKVIVKRPPPGAHARAVFETLFRTTDLSTPLLQEVRAHIAHGAVRAGLLPPRTEMVATYPHMPARWKEAAWMAMLRNVHTEEWIAEYMVRHPHPRADRLRYETHVHPLESAVERRCDVDVSIAFVCAYRDALPVGRLCSLVRSILRTQEGMDRLMRAISNETPTRHGRVLGQLVMGAACALARNGRLVSVSLYPSLAHWKR